MVICLFLHPFIHLFISLYGNWGDGPKSDWANQRDASTPHNLATWLTLANSFVQHHITLALTLHPDTQWVVYKEIIRSERYIKNIKMNAFANIAGVKFFWNSFLWLHWV